MIAYLNGNFMAIEACSISPLDRGFLFGDSAYEVLPVYDKIIFRAHEHLKRLDYSLGCIEIKNPYTHQRWNEIFSQLIARSGLSDLFIYLQVSRGSAPQRTHLPPDNIEPTVFVMSAPLPHLSEETTQSGVSAILVDDIRWHRCDIKSTNLLANVLLSIQADSHATHEAIMMRDEKVTEGVASNVFIVNNGSLSTPAVSHRLLSGITRRAVIEIAQQRKINCLEQDITKEQLLCADEVWLTSSTRNILAVTRIDKHPIGSGVPGPMWQQFSDAMMQLSQ